MWPLLRKRSGECGQGIDVCAAARIRLLKARKGKADSSPPFPQETRDWARNDRPGYGIESTITEQEKSKYRFLAFPRETRDGLGMTVCLVAGLLAPGSSRGSV